MAFTESLQEDAKGRTILSTTIPRELLLIYLFIFAVILRKKQSQGKNVTGPSFTSHSMLMSTTRWALLCRGGCFRMVLSGELNLTGWPSLQTLQLVRPTFAFLAHGQLRPQSRQNRNPSVIQSSRQKQLWWMRPGGPPDLSSDHNQRFRSEPAAGILALT